MTKYKSYCLNPLEDMKENNYKARVPWESAWSRKGQGFSPIPVRILPSWVCPPGSHQLACFPSSERGRFGRCSNGLQSVSWPASYSRGWKLQMLHPNTFLKSKSAMWFLVILMLPITKNKQGDYDVWFSLLTWLDLESIGRMRHASHCYKSILE